MRSYRLVFGLLSLLACPPVVSADEVVLSGHTDVVKAVAVSADGKKIASGGDDATVRVWPIAGGKEEWILRGHKKEVGAVHFFKNDILVSVGGEGDKGEVVLWDLKTGKEVHKFDLPNGSSGKTAVSSNEKYFAVAEGRGGDKIHVFDVAGKKKVATLEMGEAAGSIAFLGNENELIAGGFENITLFDVEKSKKIDKKEVNALLKSVSTIALGNKKQLALGGTSGFLVNDGGVSVMNAIDPDAYVHQLAYAHDGRLIGLERGRLLVTTAGGLERKKLELPGYIERFTLLPDGKIAIAVGKDVKIGKLPK